MKPGVAHRAMVATGASYRQVDYWTRRGWLHTTTGNPGSGYQRAWPAEEREICALMVRMIRAGLDTETAAHAARNAVESGRNAVALPGGIVLAWTPDAAA